MARLALTALGALMIAACNDDPTSYHSTTVRVMTRNLYLGTALEPVMAAPAQQVPLAAAQAWQILVATNFPARAGLLAAEIQATRPDVIGLQEVVLYRVQDPGDLVTGGTTPATAVVYDFLNLLMDSMEVRGLDYTVAMHVPTSDVEIPMVTGVDGGGNPTFADVRFTDGDAILVRSGITTTGASGTTYAAAIPLSVGGVPIELKRGYQRVQVAVAGLALTVYNTHLEDQVPQVQAAQLQELMTAMGAESGPVILTGDLNSRADGSSTPTYATLLAAGYFSMWNPVNLGDPGYTCCHQTDLLNPTSAMDQTIDYIILRPNGLALNFGGTFAFLVGTDPEQRTAGGLWPSDHAGIVAEIEFVS